MVRLQGRSPTARFQIGDRVRLEAGATWVIIGRYYRRSTREIVYEIQDPFTKYSVRRAERFLRPEPR